MIADIHLALAAERQREMIDRAAAARLARQVRPRGPWSVRRPAPRPAEGRKAVLRDGSEVLIAPVGPADALRWPTGSPGSVRARASSGSSG